MFEGNTSKGHVWPLVIVCPYPAGGVLFHLGEFKTITGLQPNEACDQLSKLINKGLAMKSASKPHTLEVGIPTWFTQDNQMQPAPPEMRYGRENDIKMLTTMRNGAAMIFGGRQLGKTTLLNETQLRFHNPELRSHAFLHQMDGNLDRANLSGNELDKHRAHVWKTIYSYAVSSELIKETYGIDTAGQVAALQEYFRRENPDAFMVCLDEIDPILGLDAANGFRIFRELSGLVAERMILAHAL